MKFKFFIYLSIFLLFSGNNAPLFSIDEKIEKDLISKVDKNYLNNIPKSDYIIGPGDGLNIIVSRDYPELTIIDYVDGEGTVYIPKLKRIYVQGLTKIEIESLLNEVYAEFVKFPDVEVRVVEYRPIRVLVKGEVLNPGLQILDGSLKSFSQNNSNQNDEDSFIKKQRSTYFPTVFDAIQQSGGITLFSDLSNVKVIRKNKLSAGGGQITTNLNFEQLLEDGISSQNIRIYDSDIIVIKKTDKSNRSLLKRAISSNLNSKFIQVFISGRVNIPGRIKLSKASTLTDAIDIAGGARFIRGKVRFIRFNNDGSIDKRKFAFKRSKRGSYTNPTLREGDVIIVGNSLLSTTNEVIREVTAPFSGLFSTYGLIKAISD